MTRGWLTIIATWTVYAIVIQTAVWAVAAGGVVLGVAWLVDLLVWRGA